MNNNTSKTVIEKLKAQGYSVRFHYKRYSVRRLEKGRAAYVDYRGVDTLAYPVVEIGGLVTLKEANQLRLDLLQFGGVTLCEITTPNGFKYQAEAECSKRDVFSREIGRKISMGRALKFAHAAL